jgi:hypothetical protein
MTDPVVTPEGNYYDREQILQIIEDMGQDPITYTDLAVDQLIPLPELKAQIIPYLQAHPERLGH